MIVIGADLGQAQDPTALAVAEVRTPEIHVRHLERLSLGTPYPKVVERIADLVDKLPGAALVVDATGVGRAVLDQMRESGLEPIPVTITGGRFISFDGDHWRVPKKALLRPLVAAMDVGRLKVAKGLPEAETLQVELQAFQRCITERGNNAFQGVGEHDDLVIAVALACWWPTARKPLAA